MSRTTRSTTCSAASLRNPPNHRSSTPTVLLPRTCLRAGRGGTVRSPAIQLPVAKGARWPGPHPPPPPPPPPPPLPPPYPPYSSPIYSLPPPLLLPPPSPSPSCPRGLQHQARSLQLPGSKLGEGRRAPPPPSAKLQVPCSSSHASQSAGCPQSARQKPCLPPPLARSPLVPGLGFPGIITHPTPPPPYQPLPPPPPPQSTSNPSRTVPKRRCTIFPNNFPQQAAGLAWLTGSLSLSRRSPGLLGGGGAGDPLL